MKWPLVSIGQVCVETDQRDPRDQPESLFRYVDIAAIDRESKQILEVASVRGCDAASRARKEIRAQDILVSTVRPNLNAVAIVPEDLDGEVASTGFCVLRADQRRVLPRYLFYRVRSIEFIAYLADRVTGANYPAVTDRVVKEAVLPLPPLDEQKRLAHLLDAAEELRRLRQQADRRTADLVPALFHEMFGDPAAKDWPVHRLADASAIVSGVAKGRRLPEELAVMVPYLRVANVQAGYLDLSELKTIDALPGEVEELALKRGDVLLTEGGDFDKLGRGAMWESELYPCIHQNHVFRVRVDESRLLPLYFTAFLATEPAKTYFLRCAKKTTNLASINMRQLRELPVPFAPLHLQRQFAARVAEVRSLETRQAESRRRLDDLFQSMLHRAFRGEL